MEKRIAALLEERGLNAIPTCKVCKKSPEKTADYKFSKEPVVEMLENERLTPEGKFYCTSCYIKAGMPLF